MKHLHCQSAGCHKLSGRLALIYPSRKGHDQRLVSTRMSSSKEGRGSSHVLHKTSIKNEQLIDGCGLSMKSLEARVSIYHGHKLAHAHAMAKNPSSP